MAKNTWFVSTVCLVVFGAPGVVAEDGLGTYNEDLSGYGRPRPTYHYPGWERQHQVTPAVVDAKIVQALRLMHSDDGLGSYNEDVSGYSMNASVVSTFAAMH